MIGPTGAVRVMVATRPVDFRKGAEGLATLVRETVMADPFSGAVYVFRAKRADRIKLVFWDGTGLCLFARRLEDKAPYRVERVNPAFSSQHCVVCGYTAPENRESQSVFRCKACGYTANADFNAAETIAGGHPVTARGGMVLSGLPMNREPQLSASL